MNCQCASSPQLPPLYYSPVASHEIPAPPTVPTPAPVASKPQVVHSDLIGATAGQLIQLMGQPALQVREGPGLKLQFRGRSCVLDAYLYPTPSGGLPGARHPRRHSLAERERHVSAAVHRIAVAVLKLVHRPDRGFGNDRVRVSQMGLDTRNQRL